MGRDRKQRSSGHARRRRDGCVVGVLERRRGDQLHPVLPKVMELVGLGYSAWFVYRYVLFKDSRKELQETVDDLLNKVSDI